MPEMVGSEGSWLYRHDVFEGAVLLDLFLCSNDAMVSSLFQSQPGSTWLRRSV